MPSPIVHLFPRSPFLDFVADLFEEAAPGQNSFLVLGDDSGIDRGSRGFARVSAIGSGDDALGRALREVAGSRLVIAHSMNTLSAQVFADAPPDVSRFWSGWGGDYYGTARDSTAGLLGHRTRLLMLKNREWRRWAEGLYAAPWLTRLYRHAAETSNYFSAPVSTDFPVFARRFPQFRGRYHQLHYASVENSYSLPPESIVGEDILVGNSATPENNHLEVFALLQHIGIGARRVLVPLSYGYSRYADDIEAAGRAMFGSQFVALRDFLPLPEYSALLASCRVVIMGHRRQQALGNIVRAIWQGAYVYLDDRNPIMDSLRSEGISVRSLTDLRSEGMPQSARGDDDVASDRASARRMWGRQTALSSVRRLVEEL